MSFLFRVLNPVHDSGITLTDFQSQVYHGQIQERQGQMQMQTNVQPQHQGTPTHYQQQGTFPVGSIAAPEVAPVHGMVPQQQCHQHPYGHLQLPKSIQATHGGITGQQIVMSHEDQVLAAAQKIRAIQEMQLALTMQYAQLGNIAQYNQQRGRLNEDDLKSVMIAIPDLNINFDHLVAKPGGIGDLLKLLNTSSFGRSLDTANDPSLQSAYPQITSAFGSTGLSMDTLSASLHPSQTSLSGATSSSRSLMDSQKELYGVPSGVHWPIDSTPSLTSSSSSSSAALLRIQKERDMLFDRLNTLNEEQLRIIQAERRRLELEAQMIEHSTAAATTSSSPNISLPTEAQTVSAPHSSVKRKEDQISGSSGKEHSQLSKPEMLESSQLEEQEEEMKTDIECSVDTQERKPDSSGPSKKSAEKCDDSKGTKTLKTSHTTPETRKDEKPKSYADAATLQKQSSTDAKTLKVPSSTGSEKASAAPTKKVSAEGSERKEIGTSSQPYGKRSSSGSADRSHAAATAHVGSGCFEGTHWGGHGYGTRLGGCGEGTRWGGCGGTTQWPGCDETTEWGAHAEANRGSSTSQGGYGQTRFSSSSRPDDSRHRSQSSAKDKPRFPKSRDSRGKR